MKVPSEFDSIRPYEPEELPQVYDRLLKDEQFKKVLATALPQIPFDKVAPTMHACKTNLDFQRALQYFYQKPVYFCQQSSRHCARFGLP